MRHIIIVSLLGLIFAANAGAQSPAFSNGQLVARKMEAHFNGVGYKKRLAEANARLTRRVLCAHDPALEQVECSGKLRIQGKSLSAEWELAKRTARRAKLTWTFTGPGVFQRDSEIVAPSDFGLVRF